MVQVLVNAWMKVKTTTGPLAVSSDSFTGLLPGPGRVKSGAFWPTSTAGTGAASPGQQGQDQRGDHETCGAHIGTSSSFPRERLADADTGTGALPTRAGKSAVPGRATISRTAPSAPAPRRPPAPDLLVAHVARAPAETTVGIHSSFSAGCTSTRVDAPRHVLRRCPCRSPSRRSSQRPARGRSPNFYRSISDSSRLANSSTNWSAFASSAPGK